MTFCTRLHIVAAFGLLLAVARPSTGQVIEAVGTRALGMGGAFVAVASDSSATWWNPAGLAAGPFVDLSLGRTVTERRASAPQWRQGASWFSLAAPMVGISYYRLKLTDIRAFDPTAAAAGDREDRAVGVGVQSASFSQIGLTLLHTLLPGVHAGTTIKYVSGTVRTGSQGSDVPETEIFDLGEGLEGGTVQRHVDLDAGVLAIAGPLRLGAVVRNLREPEFGDGFRLPRQVRMGAAIDLEEAGGIPFLAATDIDLRSYQTVSGPRRVVAAGAEQWLFNRRVGIRGGARVNTVGGKERSATAGISVAPRAGMFVEGHVVRGGAPDERGWGAAVRVSF